MGGLKAKRGLRGKRQASQLNVRNRTYLKTSTDKVIRGRRRSAVEFGSDELESRATPKSQLGELATLPERIVHKKLVQLLHGSHNFTYQRVDKGGRNFINGFIIDFVVIDRLPLIAIEVLGDYWHKAYEKAADLERQIAVTRAGYDYFEIWEHDIYKSDEVLENILVKILRI
jgi:very-short-patch-repair endonuclease